MQHVKNFTTENYGFDAKYIIKYINKLTLHNEND